MASLRRPLSRFLYRTLYILIYVVTLALLLVTPVDSIDQALRAPRKHQYYIIWVVAVCCTLAVAILTFVYALRLYGNGSALASIPKGWVPTAESDVGERVHKVIDAGLERSAQIAWKARPRVNSNRPGVGEGVSWPDGSMLFGQRGAQRGANEAAGHASSGGIAIRIPEQKPVVAWGDIDHDGWTSPNSSSLPPLLAYDTVISELPALTEAKALMLAPQNPSAFFRPPHDEKQQQQQQQLPVDPAAVAVLQRPPHQSFRDYICHLAGLGVISPGSTTNSFLTLYEYARFSTRPVSGNRFRELMRLFAEILRSMRSPDPVRLMSAFEEQFGAASNDGSFDDGDIDDDGPASHSPSTPRSANPSGHDGDAMFPPGLDHSRGLGVRSTSASTWHAHHQLRNALGTPKDESPTTRASPATPTPMPRIRTARTAPLPFTSSSSPVASSPSNRSFMQSKKPCSVSQYSGKSGKSSSALSRPGSIARSFVTHRSGSSGRSGSVIRLAMDGEDTGGLPFVITGTGG